MTKIIVTPIMLRTLLQPETRVNHLEAIGAIPCDLETFMTYRGDLVNIFKGILGKAEWDDQGRIIYFVKNGHGGIHHVTYDDDAERIHINAEVDHWIFNYDMSLVIKGDGKTYKQNVINEDGSLKEQLVCHEGSGNLIRRTVYLDTVNGNTTESKEEVHRGNGEREVTRNFSRVIRQDDLVITMRYRGGQLKSRIVAQGGKPIYAFNQTHPDRIASSTTYDYDEKGRLSRSLSTSRSCWYKYTEDSEGRVVQVRRKAIGSNSDEVNNQIIFIHS